MSERKSKTKLWSHKEGTKGIDRVRVFERREGGSISAEWKDSLGCKHSEVLVIGGTPVKDKVVATLIAKRISEALLQNRTSGVLELLGIKEPRTIAELLASMHEARQPNWKPSYVKQQNRYRREWEEWLGKGTILTSVKADLIDTILNRKQEANGWEPRTRNARARYIVDAYIYAQNKKKWITEDQNLSAVTFLKEDGVGLAYEEWELDLLLQVVDEVDLRLSAAFRIALDTGRRIDAILHIRLEDIEIETVWTDAVGEIELMRIAFKGENDKRKRTGWTYLTPQTRVVVERLMKSEAVQASGWLLPNRQALTVKPLRRESKEIRPVSGEDFGDYLHKAELLTQEPTRKVANGGKFVEWKHGRAFHGIKRASVTIQGSEARTLEVAAKQSGTSVQMLQARYHQDHKEDRAEMVVNLEERRKKREARAKGKASGE